MNTIVFDKLGGAVLFEDRGAPERERGGRPYGGVLDSPHVRPEMGIPDGPPLKDNLSLRHRRTGYAHLPGTPALPHPRGVGAMSGAAVRVSTGAGGLGAQSFPGGQVSASRFFFLHILILRLWFLKIRGWGVHSSRHLKRHLLETEDTWDCPRSPSIPGPQGSGLPVPLPTTAQTRG